MNNTTQSNRTMGISLENDRENDATIVKVLAYAVVLTLGLSGNFLIIAVYYRTRSFSSKRGTLNDSLIVSLSCSDLLMSIFAIPERITRLIHNERWIMPGAFGNVMCKAVNFNEAVSVVVSLLTIDAIAVERFVAVFYPLKRPVSKRKMRGIILATWFIAVSYNSPLLYYSRLTQEGKNTMFCNARTSMWDTKTWLVFYFVLASISLLVIIVCYLAIFVKISTRKTKLKRLSTNRRQRVIITRKVQRTSLVIILVFYLCYLCYWLKALLCALEHISRVCKNPVLRFLAVYLAIMNSAVNPIICFSFSSSFRQGIKRLIKF